MKIQTLGVIAAAAFLVGGITNVDANEFDFVNRKHLEELFSKTKLGTNYVKGKLFRDSYNAKQKGNLRKLLNEKSKGLGVAYFQTNEKN